MDLITDNNIGDDAAKLLSDALKTNTTLTSLDLSGEEENMIDKKGRNADWLAGNQIGDEGAKAMSEMLKVNTTLTSLDLSREEENTIEK